MINKILYIYDILVDYLETKISGNSSELLTLTVLLYINNVIWNENFKIACYSSHKIVFMFSCSQ